MTIKRIPILRHSYIMEQSLPSTLIISARDTVECVTVNGIPRVHVNGTTYVPRLEAWAKQREGVQAELERRGINSLSELTEEREKTLRSVAWDDMQRYINGGE